MLTMPLAILGTYLVGERTQQSFINAALWGFVGSIALALEYFKLRLDKNIEHQIKDLVNTSALSHDKSLIKLVASIGEAFKDLSKRTIFAKFIKKDIKLALKNANQVNQNLSFPYFLKPPEYFCFVFEHLLTILESGDRWYTITNLDLWSSENIIVNEFLITNIAAGEKGVTIERTFILEKQPTDLEDSDLNRLVEYLTETMVRGSRIVTYYYVATDYLKEVKKLGNWAILEDRQGDRLMIWMEYLENHQGRPLKLCGIKIVSSMGEINKYYKNMRSGKLRFRKKFTASLMKQLKKKRKDRLGGKQNRSKGQPPFDH